MNFVAQKAWCGLPWPCCDVPGMLQCTSSVLYSGKFVVEDIWAVIPTHQSPDSGASI